MSIELNYQELLDLIESCQELINAERIGVQSREASPPQFAPIECIDQSIDRFTDLQAKLKRWQVESYEATTRNDSENLRGFVREIMENWPIGDIDNELNSLGIKYGLLKLKDPPPDKPCGEGCTCDFDQAAFDDGLVECYEKTELLMSL